jgi:hypothetical protein
MLTRPSVVLSYLLFKCKEKLNLNPGISELMEWRVLMQMFINMDMLLKALQCSFIGIQRLEGTNIFRLQHGQEEFIFLPLLWGQETGVV